MLSKTNLVCALASAFGLIAASTQVQAAIMTWQAPETISSNLDVSTTGTLERAYFCGGWNAYPAANVNGVTFQPFQGWSNTGMGNETHSWTIGQTTLGDPNGPLYLDGGDVTSAVSPFADLSASYQAILRPAALNDNLSWSVLSPLQLTLNGLTVGHTYLFQSWVCDPRANVAGRSETLTSGGATSGVLWTNASAANGGVGQYIIGTFTADATSQTILYSANTGGVAQLNAFQLRTTATPEPSAFAMLATMLLGLLAYAWRKRK
jgi:hypothetical protein